MALQDLGTFTLTVGSLPSIYLPFQFNRRRGYGVRATFAASDFNSIFSFVRVTPFIDVAGEPSVYLADYVDLEILGQTQLFFFLGSDVYGGDGDVIFHAQRLSRYIGGDDLVNVTLNLAIEDSNIINI